MSFADWSLIDPATWQWLDTQQVLATTSVLTVLLLVVAGIAAWIQIKHARDARREEARPFVVVDLFASRASVFRLEVRNIGKTIAKDLTITFDPELESTQDSANAAVRNVPILARGASSLPPEKAHTVLVDSATKRRTSGLPDTYNVAVAYTGYDGTRYEDSQVIDFGIYWDTPDLRERDIHDIWHQLEAIKTSLHGINSALLNLQPPRDGDWGPLPRAATRPGPITEVPRSVGGGTYPSDPPPPDEDEDATHEGKN